MLIDLEKQSPASRGYTVETLSDAEPLPFVSRLVSFSASGTVSLRTLDGSVVTFTAVAGQVIPVQVTHVRSTGTDVPAASITVWY
jgi:hypothetical protein